MAILAGIDEAGFGPLLGPLVVSSSVFQTREDLSAADMWQVLRRSVGKTRTRLAGRLLIADSKKAYKRTEGVGHLERSVLASLAGLSKEPPDLTELVKCLCPDCLPRLLAYPWFQKLSSRRLPSGSPDLRIAAKVFGQDMAEAGVKLADLRSCCLDVAYYNTLMEQVKNKSSVLFGTTTLLIQHVLDLTRDESIHIAIDRQGGRVHYREPLLRSFPNMSLRIIEETEEKSAYEMRAGSRCMTLSFEVAADDRHLPVSLASMVSKYIRELLMDSMNEYFIALNPALKPTAGYWQDGLRFLADLQTHLPNVRIDSHQMVRCK
jgi:ribonuclease HII